MDITNDISGEKYPVTTKILSDVKTLFTDKNHIITVKYSVPRATPYAIDSKVMGLLFK